MPSPRSRSLVLEAALLLGSLQHALAQTSSDCNPVVNTTIQCPVDPALATSHTWTFNTTDAPSTDLWTVTAGTVDWTADGADFTINEKGDSPTIRSEFYIFGGRVEIWMKAASGQGIVSSVMMLSDDLDEIDNEFLGSDGTNVQTNYFGKGVGNTTWMTKETIDGGAFDDFHNYTVHWTNTSLEWWIDGTLKRTLTPAEANNTYSYPQTPMRVYVGPWAGGDPDNAQGTIEWAGGETDYTQGPFTMSVKSISVTDFGKGVSYNYTDNSGDWDSIQMVETEKNSTAAKTITSDSTPSPSVSEKFNSLPTGTKAAIAACSAAAVFGLFAYAMFYCYRQRKRGAAEAAAAAKRMDDERLELEGYKARGINPDGFAEQTPEYNVKTGMTTAEYSVPNSPGQAEKFGAMSMGGAAGAAASRPLLRNEMSGSPPGTPNGYVQDHYSDAFSPLGDHGYGHPNSPPSMPPSGPLPGVPNRSFSGPQPQLPESHYTGQPQRSFTNPGQQQHW